MTCYRGMVMPAFLINFLVVVGLAALVAPPSAAAQEPRIPQFWDMKERISRPQLDGLQRLRFLTTLDFPPFSYLDASGRLVGFHIDLARRVCSELGISPACQIQALPFEELEDALESGDGEAIIAGLAITAETRERLAFSRSYLRFPARFVVPRDTSAVEPLAQSLAGKRIGVQAGTAHERLLRAYFPQLRPVTYQRAEWLYRDLADGKLDAGFGDGMRLAFWLASEDSQRCCRFAGGPYLAPEFLGYGLAIAVKPDDAQMADAFNYALRELQTKGDFAELYLRYFPVSFY